MDVRVRSVHACGACSGAAPTWPKEPWPSFHSLPSGSRQMVIWSRAMALLARLSCGEDVLGMPYMSPPAPSLPGALASLLRVSTCGCCGVHGWAAQRPRCAGHAQICECGPWASRRCSTCAAAARPQRARALAGTGTGLHNSANAGPMAADSSGHTISMLARAHAWGCPWWRAHWQEGARSRWVTRQWHRLARRIAQHSERHRAQPL